MIMGKRKSYAKSKNDINIHKCTVVQGLLTTQLNATKIFFCFIDIGVRILQIYRVKDIFYLNNI